jgi:hypothetical protein
MEDDGERDDSSDYDDENADGTKIVPMPSSGSISTLRAKLHARIAALRRGGGGQESGEGEAGDRDELLEERRRQRAAMREKRRKETKEKIRREEEAKGKKGKGKEKDSRAQGHQMKVRLFLLPFAVEIESDFIPCSFLAGTATRSRPTNNITAHLPH